MSRYVLTKVRLNDAGTDVLSCQICRVTNRSFNGEVGKLEEVSVREVAALIGDGHAVEAMTIDAIGYPTAGGARITVDDGHLEPTAVLRALPRF